MARLNAGFFAPGARFVAPAVLDRRRSTLAVHAAGRLRDGGGVEDGVFGPDAPPPLRRRPDLRDRIAGSTEDGTVFGGRAFRDPALRTLQSHRPPRMAVERDHTADAHAARSGRGQDPSFCFDASTSARVGGDQPRSARAEKAASSPRSCASLAFRISLKRSIYALFSWIGTSGS